MCTSLKFYAVQSRCIYMSTTVCFLWSAYCSIKIAILLLRDPRKPIKHCSKSAFFAHHAMHENIPAFKRHIFPWCTQRHAFLSIINKEKQTPAGSHVATGTQSQFLSLISAAHNESLKCERLKFQKDRRRPDTCHPFHPEVVTPQPHIVRSCKHT